MPNNHENVILFPKWKTALEEESLLALKEKRYEEALEKLNKLLSYQKDNHEIVIGKLICLMELGFYDEAQDLCEEVIEQRDEHYYQYLHIYLTLMFQTNQYQLLMEQVEYEFSTNEVPALVREQFQQLYDMSSKLNDQLNVEKSIEYISDLLEAVEIQDHKKQWLLVEGIRKARIKPQLSVIEELLVDDTVHPVTKTALFQWLQDNGISQEISIHKLGSKQILNPSKVTGVHSHIVFKQTLLLINELEQKNPTLFQLIERLLYRYVYVRYPIMPPAEDCAFLAEALTIMGEQLIHTDINTDTNRNEIVKQYMEEIKMCETLYLTIIAE